MQAQPSAGSARAGAGAPVPQCAEAPRRTGLSAVLAATARSHPDRVVLADAGGKAAWCGRPGMTWTYATAAEIVARLARGLRAWRLPPGSRIGLWYAGGSEGLVAHLAVEAAGHVPCPLPATWDGEAVLAAAETVGLAAVLTQARLGARQPAETLCTVAARYFGLRYLAAFGPEVPDGVINLDALALERGGDALAPPETGGGLVTFAERDPRRPVHRTGEALLAAAAAHLCAARIAPGERLLSLLPPDDLRGLATGLGAALMAGASLETLPVFSLDALRTALARAEPVHVVAPAVLEAGLLDLPPPAGLRSLTLAHRAPARLTGRRLQGWPPACRVLDALALGEEATITCARGADDLALTLADPAGGALPQRLIELDRTEGGALVLRGPACRAAPFSHGGAASAPTDSPAHGGESWRPSGFRVSLFAGTVTALLHDRDGGVFS